jgi:hypothetical protein
VIRLSHGKGKKKERKENVNGYLLKFQLYCVLILIRLAHGKCGWISAKIPIVLCLLFWHMENVNGYLLKFQLCLIGIGWHLEV